LVEILHRCFQLRVIQLASVDKSPARPAAPEITGNAGIGHAAPVASDGMQHIAAFVADHLIKRRSESGHGSNPKKSPDEPGKSDGRDSNMQMQETKNPALGWVWGCRFLTSLLYLGFFFSRLQHLFSSLAKLTAKPLPLPQQL